MRWPTISVSPANSFARAVSVRLAKASALAALGAGAGAFLLAQFVYLSLAHAYDLRGDPGQGSRTTSWVLIQVCFVVSLFVLALLPPLRRWRRGILAGLTVAMWVLATFDLALAALAGSVP